MNLDGKISPGFTDKNKKAKEARELENEQQTVVELQLKAHFDYIPLKMLVRKPNVSEREIHRSLLHGIHNTY